jgi:hypothetical protein
VLEQGKYTAQKDLLESTTSVRKISPIEVSDIEKI